MSTQQVVALLVICLFIIGLFAYAYFLGKKAGRAHHPTGLLFDSPPCAGHSRSTSVSLQISASEGSGHDVAQAIRDAFPASLREVSSIDAQKTKSLCCEAAGIIHSVSSPAEALIPHDKLREAAPVEATLIAKSRPHAQPAEGYTHSSAVSCIVAAMDATLAVNAGTYTTSEQMALAIEGALRKAGFFMRDEAYQALSERPGALDDLHEHHCTAGILKHPTPVPEDGAMSRTGMPVTKDDYELLLRAAKTLHLTERIVTAMKAIPHAIQASQQAMALESLTRHAHEHLRQPLPTCTTSVVAA